MICAKCNTEILPTYQFDTQTWQRVFWNTPQGSIHYGCAVKKKSESDETPDEGGAGVPVSQDEE